MCVFSDESQKKLRKQKILINKLRRHGTMLPEDTYAISPRDIEDTYRQKINGKTVKNLKEQYPHLSDKEIETLCGEEAKPQTGGKGKNDISPKLTQFLPWQDLRDSLLDIIEGMEPYEKKVLLEMNKAHESSAFLANTTTRLKHFPTNPTEVFNIADGFVRRIIKVAKQLDFFRSVDKEDQIALLKGSVVEIMMLRSAVNFDVKTETWNLSTINCIKPTESTSASNTSPSSSENQSNNSFMPPSGLNINQLRQAAMNGTDINSLRNMAKQGNSFGRGMGSDDQTSPTSSDSQSNDSCMSPGGLNIDQLRQAAMNGADINALRNMAKQGGYGRGGLEGGEQMRKSRTESVSSESESNEDKDLAGLESLRNAARAAGFDVDALRKAAMNGASFAQLSQMAHSTAGGGQDGSNGKLPDGAQVKQEPDSSAPSGSGNCISSEILKLGNSETKTMFLTYSKFIRSLMNTIFGDLIVLKFLIMLSLFSPDRQGIQNRALVDQYQEIYANCMKKYIEVRFPDTKNMFARCIMKLTDLRNVNEVHTKMLLKMQIDNIEPLLVEIFDLPQ